MKMNSCLAVLFTSFLSFSLYSNEIILAEDEWCPYSCVPSSNKPGYVEEGGILAKYGVPDWKRLKYKGCSLQ